MTLYVTVTTITYHDKSVIPVTDWLYMSQSQVTQLHDTENVGEY